MNSITENMTTEYGVNCTVSAGEDVIQTLIEQSGCALKVTTVAGRGKGLVATSKIEEGTVIACESPLLCMQNNIRDIVTCACCCATVGSIMQQIDVAARVLQPVDMDMDAEDDWKLPTLPSETGEGEPHLTEKIVGCPLECGNVYCSKKCRDADQNEHGHSLLCVGQIDSLDHPLYQFKVHSLTTQEEFLLAAKALAVMMGVLWAADEDEQGGTLAQSLLKPYAHFQSGVWWDLAGGQEMAGVLQAQATEAFQLLQAAWSDLGHLPENTHGIMSMDTFNRLLSIFHLNNVGVRRVSPISRYMKIASQLSDAATQDEIFDTLMSHVDPILMGDGCDDSDCDDSDCDDRESESESESEGEASSESGMESGTTSKPEIPDNSGTDSAIEPSACNDANDGDVEEEEEEQQQQQQQQQGEEGEEEDDDDEEEEEVTAAMTLGDWGDADIEAGESLFPMFDGCGLFPLISAINHSCEPNCKVTYGTTGRGKLALELRSLCSINSDTEITISYTATDLPAEERQEILGKYGFRCNCTKCQRGD